MLLLGLSPPGGIAMRRVCWFVRSCVRERISGTNISKKVADKDSVANDRQ